MSEKKKSFADTSQLSLDIAMFAPGFQAASLELLARGSHGILYQYPRRGARERTCAGDPTCRQVPPAGWVESAMKKLDEEPIRNSKKAQETQCDGQSQRRKGDGTKSNSEEATKRDKKSEGSSVQRDSSGSKWKNGTKVVAKKKCSWVKCWLTVWLWLSLSRLARSLVGCRCCPLVGI